MTDVISHENAVVDLDAAQPQPGMASDELVRQLAERARAEGLRLLDWLVAEQTAPRGHFSFTPTHGEAGAMADAAARAFTVTGQADWADVTIRSAGWFTGRNDLGVAMFDDRTGGCFDGLQVDGPNVNQGAESTIVFLTALRRAHEVALPSDRACVA